MFYLARPPVPVSRKQQCWEYLRRLGALISRGSWGWSLRLPLESRGSWGWSLRLPLESRGSWGWRLKGSGAVGLQGFRGWEGGI